MNVKHYIEKNELPLPLNFKELKNTALTYIQESNSSTWTNLNPSDPGVTILDQLCYAFTELGYCNEFPIKDVLTDKKGQLEIENQFYLPEEILTTSPITINDFRKYLVDNVQEIINVQITPLRSSLPFVKGVYQTRILLDRNLDKKESVEIRREKNGEDYIERKELEDLVLNKAYFVLNTCRNLGELFQYPMFLTSKKHTVYGDLEIENGYKIEDIMITINKVMNNYVYPELLQQGYDELEAKGENSNTIFNGPELKNGWIQEENLRAKKNRIQSYEIAELIQAIEGVISIKNLYLDTEGNTEVTSKEDEILVFDFIEASGNSFNIEFYRNGRSLNKSIKIPYVQGLSDLASTEAQISKVSAIKLTPDLPQGKYRDIESYYSIQNTFPEVYAVGVEGVSASATAFQIAQSRQLKGYLTLFDQVLANQFMQLANVNKLFSFENAVTGAPSDRDQFYSVQSFYEQENPKYPAPYLTFSPTYFYQSLYKEVPNARPLLRNFQSHDYNYGFESPEEITYKGWKKYQQDPYNSYMWGLMYFMEDETDNLHRRNAILNHLLARHGIAPEEIDSVIEGTVFSGNLEKDKVIIKSLLLQNFGLLSYYRVKSYNFIGANFLELGYLKEDTVSLPENTYQKLREKLVQGNQKDFIFKTIEVNEAFKVESSDFIDFSALELKLNLLFTLNAYYQDYLINYNNVNAYWLITQRKGFLCIETDLLKKSASYQIVFKETGLDSKYWKVDKEFTYKELLDLEDRLVNGIDGSKITINTLSEKYTLVSSNTSDLSKQTFSPIDNTSLNWFITLSWGDSFKLASTHSLLQHSLIFVFPEFFKGIGDFHIVNFEKRLNRFLQNEIPVQLEYEYLFTEGEPLRQLILNYTNWYNSLRFDQKTESLHGTDLVANARKLIQQILHLKSGQYE